MAPQRIRLSWATEPFDLHLTPLHALIGPAGVGKTATLDAVRVPPGYTDPEEDTFDGASGLFGLASLLKGHLASIYRQWDLIGKYYPWVEGLEEGKMRPFPRVFCKGPSTNSHHPCVSYPSLASLLVAIALPDICKERHYTLICIDNPDHNFHPEQIADVMKLLRHTADSGVQVVVATNNPLVINEMQPEEVTVLTRGEHGPKATLLRDTWNFAERSRFYALGELWLLHGGNNEHDLLHEPQPNGKAAAEPSKIEDK